jgi:hypothetical protein
MKHFCFLLTCLVAAAAVADDDTRRQQLAFFEKEVRPLLATRCFECHGEKKQESGLRIDHIEFLKKGGDSGPAIAPGNLDKSLLIQAIRYSGDFQMPPKGKLPAAEIAVLEKWVQLGAPWPEETVTLAKIKLDEFSEDDRNFWCFRPLTDPQPPQVESKWIQNDIDRFIASKHAEMKLLPAAEADRRELVRRLYFDLHGLPPTREQAEAFVNDKDPKAYENLVDALLASPRYGERWAQHWLDLARYAESDGYNADAYRPAAWPYRDWVIKSLNDDMPYDRFVREQLAGDEIAPDDPNVLIATSFMRQPVYEWNQRDVRGQWEIIVTDMTDTTGELFLGLSFGCARCHNHKFDPILQKDYYRLRAFFTPVLWRDDLFLGTPEELAKHAEKKAAWEAATTEVRAEIHELIAPLLEPRVDRALERFGDDLQAMVRKPTAERGALEQQLAGLCQRQMTHERTTFDAAKTIKKEADKARYQELQAKLKEFDKIKPAALVEAFVATDAGPTAPPTLMKSRQGEQDVAPGFLSLLCPEDAVITPLANSTGRRTALAKWITRTDNQLTTRVIVNRVWQYHFGRGIVATSSDFGRLGEQPSHPELLDWLARRFVSQGWSLKQLHKEILLSATYRQTAHRQVTTEIASVDPTNKYLWRFSPQRLDAEQARDAMLLASGELDFKAGGPPDDGNSTRRSIYTRKKRNSQNELLRSLDAPAGFSSTAERQSTITPTQALLLINGEWSLARAKKLAARAGNIDKAWQLALGRLPTAGEREQAEAFLQNGATAESPSAPAKSPLADSPDLFKENTPQERLIVQSSDLEGDEFTVQAIFQVDSIDAGSAPQSIISRWNGNKDSIEAFGWNLAVTGKKSNFTPQSVIVQLVGEDDNSNIAYEVAASHLKVELGHRYHVVVTVSCPDHSVTFRLQDLSEPTSTSRTAVAKHAVRSKLGAGVSSLVIGGLSKRSAAHQWDGHIEAVQIAAGMPRSESASIDPVQWPLGLVSWIATAANNSPCSWAGSDAEPVAARDASRQALVDLCQILLNTNEFFYLH